MPSDWVTVCGQPLRALVVGRVDLGRAIGAGDVDPQVARQAEQRRPAVALAAQDHDRVAAGRRRRRRRRRWRRRWGRRGRRPRACRSRRAGSSRPACRWTAARGPPPCPRRGRRRRSGPSPTRARRRSRRRRRARRGRTPAPRVGDGAGCETRPIRLPAGHRRSRSSRPRSLEVRSPELSRCGSRRTGLRHGRSDARPSARTADGGRAVTEDHSVPAAAAAESSEFRASEATQRRWTTSPAARRWVTPHVSSTTSRPSASTSIAVPSSSAVRAARRGPAARA